MSLDVKSIAARWADDEQQATPVSAWSPGDLAALRAEFANAAADMTQDTITMDSDLDHAAGDDFWSARPSLSRIRDFARARRVSPDAVLAAVLVRAVATVPPTVTLPPTVAGAASLNLFTALVGPPGAGKGGSDAVAAAAVTFHGFVRETVTPPRTIRTLPIGTGEGIVRAFMPPTDGDPLANEAAIFTAPEVDTLAALLNRQGATLGGVVRSAFMGEQIGFTNASKDTTTNVEAHTYRMGLIVGVQPLRAGVLLEGSDGGTPQRFLWASVTDPDAPETAPEQPEPLQIQIHNWQPGHFKVTPIARAEVDAHRLAVLRENPDIDPLDGHRLLLRLKIAAALAVLESRQTITEDDWKLARQIQAHSDRVRAKVVTAAADAARKRTTARAIAADERDRVIADRRHARARAHIERRLRDKGEQAHTTVLESAKSDIRKYLGAAVAEMVDEGLIAVREETAGNNQTATWYVWISP